MNIYKQELKMLYKSLIYYTVGILAVIAVFLFFYDTFAENTAIINKMLSNFPQEFKAAFGFADLDTSEFNGFLCFLSSYVVLIGAVYGMKTGISVLSEEGRARTADFLLSKPVGRTKIVSMKVSAVLTCLLLQNIALYLVSLFLISVIEPDENLNLAVFTLISLSVLLVQLFFAGTGFFISVVLKKIKTVMPVTLAVVFMFFIIELINQSLLEEKMTYITPFSYFKGSQIYASQNLETRYLVIDLAVFAAFTAASFALYRKKDIRAPG